MFVKIICVIINFVTYNKFKVFLNTKLPTYNKLNTFYAFHKALRSIYALYLS